MSPDPRKTGLFIVGVRGAVATTVLHGLEALRSGLPPVGMVTAAPEFDSIKWEPVGGFRVHGWDVAGNLHRSAEELGRTRVVPQDLVELCADLRDRVELSLAPGIADPEDVELVDRGARERLQLSPAQMVAALRGDIREWRRQDGCQRAVVVYLASAERQRVVPEEWQDAGADPFALLERAPRELSRSLLYGLAAVAEGYPFINFTPAPGGAVPALAGYAQRNGVPVLGNDGKTGETLVKTVLAPMFRDRALSVLAWEGYNMLGNRDGAALSDPQRRAAKIANKDRVLTSILGDPRTHTHVGIDFVPSLHDWKTAWDFIHFEGFLGARMSLQFTWQGSDSALAAPLVLDLTRIALHAQDRGQGGPLTAAAPFFKNPLGVSEHDFHRQMAMFRAWVAAAEPA